MQCIYVEKYVGCMGYLCYPFPETNCIIKDCVALVKNFLTGDPYRIRTDVNGVRGRCLNHLTNGPCRWKKLRTIRFRLYQKLIPLRSSSSSSSNALLV